MKPWLRHIFSGKRGEVKQPQLPLLRDDFCQAEQFFITSIAVVHDETRRECCMLVVAAEIAKEKERIWPDRESSDNHCAWSLE